MRRGADPIWWIGLGAALLLIGAMDALLLDQLRGYFRSGYNTVALRSGIERGAFALASSLQDAALVCLSAGGITALLSRARARPITAFLAAVALPLFLVLAADLVLYKIHRVLGDVTAFSILVSLAGGTGAAAREAASEQPIAVVMLLSLLLLVVLAIRWAAHLLSARSIGPRTGPPWRTLLIAGTAAFLASTLVLKLSSAYWPALHQGLSWKPSGWLVQRGVDLLTDVDRDGFGWLTRPGDHAPFDAHLHPAAIDLPGNGIDENGVAGDLPAGFRAPAPEPLPAWSEPARRPDFLLVMLETFRGDLIGQTFGGREVTPFLNSLAAEGASSHQAWTNTPTTKDSRAQLFQGRVAVAPGASTLIDDFEQRGYEVVYVSGQDEHFGSGRVLAGWDRADIFRDARDFKVQTSRTRSPVSLQISWRTLLAELESILSQRDGSKPMFLYVNIVDTHYPYHHDGLENLLGIQPVDRAHIRPEHARAVFETYLNAAANVDRAVEQVVGAFAAQAGARDQAVLVTADHGQAFYERGQLGHGQDLDASQARIPLIRRGVGGTWPEPLALSDVRGLLLRHLFDASPAPARFQQDPRRRLLQYVGSLERPARIALRGLAGTVLYDPRSGRCWRRDSQDEPVGDASAAEADELIHSWEAIRAQAAQRRDPERAPG